MAKTIPLCTANIANSVKSGYKPKHFTLPKDLKFEVGLSVDDTLYKKINDDDKLANKIFSEVSKEYKGTVTKIVNLTKFIDKQAHETNQDKLVKQWGQDMNRYFDEAEAAMVKKAESEIKAWQKTRNDRVKYKIKAAAKVTVGTLGFATATVGAVVSVPAGGAGAVVALVGLAKSIRNLYKELKSLADSVDKAEKNLRTHLDKMTKSYRGATKGHVVTKELIAAAIAQVTTVDKVSISVCEKEFGTFHGKLAGTDIKASELGKKIHALLDQQAAINKDIVLKMEKELKNKGYTSKKLPKLKTKIAKIESTTKENIKKAEALYNKVDSAKAREQGYQASLRALKAKKPDWVDNAEAAMKLIDLGLGAAVTDFSSLEQVLVLVDSIGVEIDDVLADKL